MKPYEEITFPNGSLRWIREDGMYVCRMTGEYMEKMKAQHEVKREWQGLTEEQIELIAIKHAPPVHPEFGDDDWIEFAKAIDKHLKEKNHG